MKSQFLLFYLFFSIATNALQSADPSKTKKAKSLYQSILKTQWLEEKKNMGSDLGKLGSEAEPFILKLYDAESYWDRIAAVNSSAFYFSPSVNQRLVKSYLEDHMVENETESVIEANLHKYVDALLERWETDTESRYKNKLIRMLAKSTDTKATEITRQEINDKKSNYRKVAFQALAEKLQKKDKDYIRSKVTDKDLRQFSLKYILETGDAQDKELMFGVLNDPGSSEQESSYAISGIKKWGTFQEQEKVYTQIIRNPKSEESLILFSIILFGEFLSEPIRESLCESAKYARDQTLRITAAEALVPFQNPKNIDCLKRIVKEDYQSSSQGFGFVDAVAMFATLGISNVLRGIQENRSRANFFGRQNELKKHIQFLELKAKENE